MASSTETAVERTIAIDASPETVWQFLVDPEKTTTWWGMTASFDPRPGGEYRIEVIPGHTASGEFVELDAPRRLVYTFGWEAGEDGANPTPPGSSTIEIELVPDGAGTVLQLHASRPPECRGLRIALEGLGSLPGAPRHRGSRWRSGRRPLAQRRDVGNTSEGGSGDAGADGYCNGKPRRQPGTTARTTGWKNTSAFVRAEVRARAARARPLLRRADAEGL